MMGRQGEDSFLREKRNRWTQQERKRRGDSSAGRGKRSLAGNQPRWHKLSIRANVSICSSLDWIHFVMSQPHFLNF
ncbi:hypothetical protein P4625_00290 [Priestia megaterium]|nr:hypothetical protein [Priestia megaterium]